MPIKRRLTPDEIRARRLANPGNRANATSAYELHTFLTDEDKALLAAADERGDTVEEFMQRLDGKVADGDREELGKALADRRAAAERAARRRNARPTPLPSDDQPIRVRQPKSATNPTGVYLDPRHDNLPEYPVAGLQQIKRLDKAAEGYTAVADRLEEALAEMEDEFAAAFAAEDGRRATRARITGAGMSDAVAAQRKRTNRIG